MKRSHTPSVSRITALFLAAVLLVTACQTCLGNDDNPADLAGLQGGLIVQLGASDTQAAAELSRTGRYLIHVLDTNAKAVQAAQQNLHQQGRYGLAWAEQPVANDRLPYAENLVNLIVAKDFTVPVQEMLRVLTPGGSAIAKKALADESFFESNAFTSVRTSGAYVIATKAWPNEMDAWSHPRHAADGNAVSLDSMVGPPERVRWIAAATSEVEGMVTAGGRNFYGGILARDSFNGLRLWHRHLAKPGENNPQEFALPRLAGSGSRPIASDQFVFASLGDRPVALNAATGEVAVDFGDLRSPKALLFDGFRVIAADNQTVRAFDVQTGKEIWNAPAAEPNNVIGDGKLVALIQGRVKRGEKAVAVVLDAATGEVVWTRDDYPWLVATTRTVLAKGQLVFEVSTMNDHDAGNAIHVVSAATGEPRWSKDFPPGMNHARQARAMFLEDDIWILHGGKINTNDKENRKRSPTEVSALDPLTGAVRKTFPAGMAHCFPPVCTPNFMFAGELDMTNLNSGEVIANRITKANCSRESGWIPANGLVYTTPKHCTCWPMLRGYVAMAPAAESTVHQDINEIKFLLERGSATVPTESAPAKETDWPLYRHDRWRSGSTVTAGPTELSTLWTSRLNEEIEADAQVKGPIISDWKENPVVKGPLSAPTVAAGIAYVTRPNAHELIAIDTATGEIRWRFTANGRLDTPPAIHRGLCLFGSAAGWVYALRADDGQLVWRMRAAPTDERIVAYGQVESPWPVPGAILVMDDVAYFAAGRQPLADGGILVFAVDPMTGEHHWTQRLDSVPQKGFYENSGLEFDPFDILHAEGDSIAMSRWIVSRDGQNVDVDKWNAFAKLNTGAGEVWIPRGTWTYGARHQDRFRGEAERRPLTVFRDKNVFSFLDGSTEVFRREFHLQDGEKFNSKWITGWEAARTAREGGKPYRNQRISTSAQWIKDPFTPEDEVKVDPKYGTQLHNEIHAMALAGDEKLYVVHRDGRLKVLSTETGYVIEERTVPPPAWDGLAIADGKLFLTTQAGQLICLGQ
ncbi:MAG: PQQ-binding-like beta-propeller repeat protein [Planctomycetaceae bacterium]|nr:PQQ-binding-like beta-propeller repeat protein [Planctomycetaceae bacterium]